MEPEAQETFTYAVGPQKDLLTPSNGPFQQIGLDERPRAKWVKDTWNKLGFYLHAEWPFAKRKKAPASLSEFLEKTLDEIAPLVANAFSATLIPTIEFYCQACKTKVKVMQKSVAASGGAVCLTCGMQYRAERTGNSITFFPDAPPFVCDCGESTYLPFDEVRAGYEFGCRVCSRRYVIAGPQWLYRLVGDGNLESDADTQQGQVEQSGCSQE
ncbi:MAG TPA: hypothetical protein VMF91_07330 [Bryobacteraceae bacterium]|nr:hypothetical protein [Bryobacteraceae bacterium]